MKKAVVIGGSSGIGLGISKILAERGYFIEVFSKDPEDCTMLPVDSYTYHHCNLVDFDEQLFKELASDVDVEVLMITAGFGRVAEFKAHHIAEIDSMMTVNAVSVIKILRLFYERILAETCFYTGVMGSISGWLSSPMASVYAASKAAIVRFIESVNIELEMEKTKNRILDISPASFKGSRFYGGKTDLSLLLPLAEQIVTRLLSRETLYIPEYEEILKNVLEQYHNNPHEYGVHSYEYKAQSGRVDNRRRVKIGYLSGTFDLFHVGHLNLLRRAREMCDYLIVGVHESGAWKGKQTFIPFEERKAIVASCKYVNKVVDSCKEDLDAWDLWHFDRLFVGSDYKGTERFQRYEQYFEYKDVEIIYFPYTQSTSSTQIRNAIMARTE